MKCCFILFTRSSICTVTTVFVIVVYLVQHSSPPNSLLVCSFVLSLIRLIIDTRKFSFGKYSLLVFISCWSTQQQSKASERELAEMLSCVCLCTTCQTANIHILATMFAECSNVSMFVLIIFFLLLSPSFWLYFTRRYNYYCYNVSYLLLANYQDSCSQNIYVKYALISNRLIHFQMLLLSSSSLPLFLHGIVSLRLEYLSLYHCRNALARAIPCTRNRLIRWKGTWLAWRCLPFSIPIHFTSRTNDKEKLIKL